MKGESDGFFAKIVIARRFAGHSCPRDASVLHNSVVTFTANVTNLGPDGSDAVILRRRNSQRLQLLRITGSTATSCTVPAIGGNFLAALCATKPAGKWAELRRKDSTQKP